jgi:hypothetical protein
VTTRSSEAPLSHGHLPGPPDSDRAWEQISAPDLGGNPVGPGAEISDDGTRAIYGISGGTPSSETGAFNQFFAERTPNGWQTRDIYPRRSEVAATSWILPAGRSDLAKFFPINVEFGGTAAIFSVSPDDPPTKLFEGRATLGHFVGVPENGSRLVVALKGTSPDPSHPAISGSNLYDLSSGSPRMVGLLPGEVPPPCGVEHGYAEGDGTEPTRTTHWMSADGNTLFFPSLDNGCGGSSSLQVYMRDLVGEESTLISGPPLSGPDCGGAFIKSTPDAAFIWSKSRLSVEDAAPSGCSDYSKDGDVYRYDLGDGGFKCVTCVLPGIATDVPLPPGGLAGEVRERVAVAEDGSRVYFTASTQLLPGARSPGVYRVDVKSGDLAYIGHVNPFLADVVRWGNALTPDGSVLIFRSDDASLNPLGGPTNAGSSQYYRYDDRDRSLVCLSCPADGSAPRGNVRGDFSAPIFPAIGPNQTPLSADGNTFAFTTPTRLVPIDQNTAAPGQDARRGTDAYEWRDGRLLLVSDGLTNWPGFLSVPEVDGVTPSGKDIVFSAAAQYTADALDDYQRIYDAKIGGGIEFPKPPPPCPLEVCQGTPKGAPGRAAPGTASFSGQGNAKPKKASHKRKHKKRRHKAHKKASKQRASHNRRSAR